MNRYLALDYGEKRIGAAVSDPTFTIAQPLRVIRNKSRKILLQELRQLCTEYHISKIILGLPITLRGTDSEKTTEVREFARQLELQVNIPVHLMDERLTSVQAQNTLQFLGKKPSREKEKVDLLAAQYILQTFMDREKSRGHHEST